MRLAVLASGSGTLLEAILSAGLPVEVVAVDRPCRATEVAAAHEFSALVVERTDFGPGLDRDAYTRTFVQALEPAAVDLVVMAGFGTILGSPMHDAYPHRILNTHPALLPSFKGWHAVRDALDYGVKVTGCTVHLVDTGVDTGPIIAQRVVMVEPGDDEDSLHERIKQTEWRLLPEVVNRLVTNGCRVEGRKVEL